MNKNLATARRLASMHEKNSEGQAPEPAPSASLKVGDDLVATVELPSRGMFYGDKCSEGTVRLRPMTGKDEGFVADMDPGQITEIFDLVLTRCFTAKDGTDLNPGLQVSDLLGTDKYYLMLRLRANSYGSSYEFRVRCPSCGLFNSHTSNVPDDFSITFYEGSEKEPFSTDLPRSGDSIQFRLLRGKDEKDIINYRNREMETGAYKHGDPAHIYRLAKHVVAINGNEPEDIGVAMDYLGDLIAEDVSALQNAIDDRASGVDTEFSIQCVKCKTKYRSSLPFTAGFFRTGRTGSGEST